jgi:hypothetical protein
MKSWDGAAVKVDAIKDDDVQVELQRATPLLHVVDVTRSHSESITRNDWAARLREAIAVHGWSLGHANSRKCANSANPRQVRVDMAHGDVLVRSDARNSLTTDSGVPDFDLALELWRDEALHGECRPSCVLASRILGNLLLVARGATVVATITVAVLSVGRIAMRGEQADGASAIHGTLELGQIVGSWEGLLSAGGSKLTCGLGVDIREEETRTTEWSLLHDRRVAELLDESLTTLDGGVRDLGSLVGAVSEPAATLNVVDESDHSVDVGEVDEGVANIAARLEVNAKVHEVVGAKALLIEDSLEGRLQ